MPHLIQSAPRTPHVDGVVRQVLDQIQPSKIYLYNRRVNDAGDTTNFKLCIVCAVPDKQAAEIDLYRKVDSEVPFDLLLYTPQEWEQLLETPGAFAGSIAQKGTLLYG